MVNWMRWFPDNVSTYGADVDSVFALIYWVGLVWFVITLGTFGLFLVLYRRRQGRRAVYITGGLDPGADRGGAAPGPLD